MRSMCWRATARRRSATCATSPTPSSATSRRRSPRRRSPRRSACSATASAPSASTPPALRCIRAAAAALDSAAHDYGSTLRDAAALVTLASEGGAPRADHRQARSSASKPRATCALVPRRRKMPGSCWRRARSASEAPAVARYRRREAASAALPQLPCRRPRRRAAHGSPTPAMTPVQAVVSVTGAPITPEPAAEKGFKIERLYYTLDGKPADRRQGAGRTSVSSVVLKITEPQPQFGRVYRRRLSAGRVRDRQSAVWCRPAIPVRWPGSRMPPSRCNTEFRDDRFTAAFDRERQAAGGVHGRLRGARGVARQLRACRRPRSRTCTGPTVSAAPHRDDRSFDRR